VAVDELHEADSSDLGQLRELEADLAMLLAEEDVEEGHRGAWIVGALMAPTAKVAAAEARAGLR
jgi:hypothetical protein